MGDRVGVSVKSSSNNEYRISVYIIYTCVYKICVYVYALYSRSEVIRESPQRTVFLTGQ